MKKRNVLLMILCLCMVLMLVPSAANAEEKTVPSSTVLNDLYSNYINKTGYGRYDGLCLAFVADFWQRYAGYRVSDTSAYDFSQRRVSINANYDIPIGADVFFDGWATTKYGWERVGHIGIYIGSGQFASAAGGKGTCIVVRNISEYYTYRQNGSVAVQYMGWAWHPGIRVSSKATLDVNGYLDGKTADHVYGYGSFDMYLNGQKKQTGVGDFWDTELKTGSTYRISNVKAASGKVFAGFKSGTYTGTLNKDETIVLEFRTLNSKNWIQKHSPAAEKSFNGHTYKYYTDKVTYWEANNICKKLGGYLVAINSKEENSFVSGLIKETSWIGVNDRDKEGTFRLAQDGNKIAYANWSANEPNNYPENAEGGEDYCSMYGPETGLCGQWNDVYSYAQYGFVCEINKDTNKYTLDVNGWIDGKEVDNLNGIGTFDSYIDGKKTENDIHDYYNTILPSGTKYEIKDVQAADGYEFVGVKSGALSGTLNGNARIVLEFRKPSFSFAVETSKKEIGETYAQLGYFKIYTNVDINIVKRVGCILYASDKSYLASDEEDAYVVGDHLTHYFRISGDAKEEDVRYRLSPGTTYMVRVYIVYKGKRYYSDWQTFTTKASTVAEIPATPRPTTKLTTASTPAPVTGGSAGSQTAGTPDSGKGSGASASSSKASVTIVNVKHKLNVRKSANSRSRRIGYAYNGEVYPLLAVKGDWYKIQFSPNMVGYIHKQYAKATNERVVPRV